MQKQKKKKSIALGFAIECGHTSPIAASKSPSIVLGSFTLRPFVSTVHSEDLAVMMPAMKHSKLAHGNMAPAIKLGLGDLMHRQL